MIILTASGGNSGTLTDIGADINSLIEIFKNRDWDHRIAFARFRGKFYVDDKSHAKNRKTGALAETFLLGEYSTKNKIIGKSGKHYLIKNSTDGQKRALRLDAKFITFVNDDDYTGAEKTLRDMHGLLKVGVWFE